MNICIRNSTSSQISTSTPRNLHLLDNDDIDLHTSDFCQRWGIARMEIRPDQTFPFFDLPPELREWVYEYLSGDEVCILSPSLEASMSVVDYPLANILCVSKQIKQEYEHVAAHKTKLVYTDHQDFDFTLPPLPARLVEVKNIELRMFVVCEHTCPGNTLHCEAANDLRQTFSLISDKASTWFAGTNFELKLGLWWKADEKWNWPETPHADNLVTELKTGVEKLEQSSRVDVYRSSERCLEADKIVNNDNLLVTYTRESGWQAGRSQQPDA